jgi:hypothetical protein
MGRLRKRNIRNKLVGFLVTAFSVLSLPIIVPAALIQERIRTRRITRVVCRFVCVSCGKALGLEGLRLGNERWGAIIAELHERSPGSRFRVLQGIHAICPECGCEYRYQDGDQSLVQTTT